MRELTEALHICAVGTGDARGVPLALLIQDDGEIDLLPFVERSEALRVDDRVVHEHVSEHRLGVTLPHTHT